MNPESPILRTGLAALPLGPTALPGHAPDRETESGMSFIDHNSDKNGFLSLKAFQARGKDDLACRAADIGGDGRLTPDESDTHARLKTRDQSESGSLGGN